MELIDKSKLLEGLKELKQNLSASPIVVIEDVESLVEDFEVKEVADVRFPHEKNIVDKVFGAGNLEYWEINEAKALVALAKEELLKDLESKEVDWEEVRIKSSIAAMQGTITILSSSDRYAFREVVVEGFCGEQKTYPNEIAQFSVAVADALIKELKDSKAIEE